MIVVQTKVLYRLVTTLLLFILCRLARSRYTILSDQVNNLRHYNVLLVVSERHLSDKAPDLSVNLAPGASLGVVLHGRLNFRRRHTMRGYKKPI